MEKLAVAVMRWRYLVLALEVLVAGGCVYSGWRLAARVVPAAIEVTRAAPALAAPLTGAVPLPQLPLGSRLRVAPALPGPDVLRRLSQDDVDLYHRQWEVVQLVMAGVRRYIETRVMPGVLAS